MRILVFSDSHTDISSASRIIENLVGVDMILHAGDHISDAEKLAELFPDIPLYAVKGNCDFSAAPNDLIVTAGGKKIFLTHGHCYNVKYEDDYSSLLKKAEDAECDCAVFGHTHIPVCDMSRRITLLNPGSINYGRTFGVIEIENGVLKAAVCNV